MSELQEKLHSKKMVVAEQCNNNPFMSALMAGISKLDHVTPASEELLTSLRNEGYMADCMETRGGYSLIVTFENGYGADITKFPGTYGCEADLWELAVVKGQKLCYDTPVTGDVIGGCDEEELLEYCKEIAKLPPVPERSAEQDLEK